MRKWYILIYTYKRTDLFLCSNFVTLFNTFPIFFHRIVPKTFLSVAMLLDSSFFFLSEGGLYFYCSNFVNEENYCLMNDLMGPSPRHRPTLPLLPPLPSTTRRSPSMYCNTIIT